MNDFDAFKSKLPEMRRWIDHTLEEYSDRAIPVTSIPFSNLGKVLPMEILKKAKIVVVDGPVPVPPLSSEMGLTKLKALEEKKDNFDGITYKDTYFINLNHLQSEKLHFHELVHVVQWDELGVDNFLLAYGVGMMQADYYGCPLEKMAYSLQNEFDRLSGFVDHSIREKTEGIWNEVQRLCSFNTDPSQKDL